MVLHIQNYLFNLRAKGGSWHAMEVTCLSPTMTAPALAHWQVKMQRPAPKSPDFGILSTTSNDIIAWNGRILRVHEYCVIILCSWVIFSFFLLMHYTVGIRRPDIWIADNWVSGIQMPGNSPDINKIIKKALVDR